MSVRFEQQGEVLPYHTGHACCVSTADSNATGSPSDCQLGTDCEEFIDDVFCQPEDKQKAKQCKCRQTAHKGIVVEDVSEDYATKSTKEDLDNEKKKKKHWQSCDEGRWRDWKRG